MNKIFKHKGFNLVVYVEDTDFQGFVYHANYIKYFERARSDFLTFNNILDQTLTTLSFILLKLLNEPKVIFFSFRHGGSDNDLIELRPEWQFQIFGKYIIFSE